MEQLHGSLRREKGYLLHGGKTQTGCKRGDELASRSRECMRSSVAPKPQSRALPPEETISSDNETRLKQSGGRIALGLVLTKCSPWALPPLNFRPRAWTS